MLLLFFFHHKIPIPVANISSVEHSVNVGISDAYYVDKLRHYYGICKCCMIIMQSANCKFPGAYFVPQSIHIKE